MHYDIVIVGGGAGGLELAASLGRKLGRELGRQKVLLVDKSIFHIWKPTLHEVAAGTVDIHQEGLSYSVLALRNHFSFGIGELIAMDTDAKRISLGEIRDERDELVVPARDISYSWCVLALGSGSNFFGTPGAENAHILEQTGDAETFRRDLLSAFTRAAFSEQKALAIGIVGGGATGVELSAELLESHQMFLASSPPENRFRLDITIVEAAARILGTLPEKISAQATLTLERKGIRVLTDTKVLELKPHVLITSQGEIKVHLIVWAAGIKAGDLNTTLGVETNRINQIAVNTRLETSARDVYAFGDCAACPWVDAGIDGATIPARAQAAHQQSDYLAKVLMARLRERRIDGEFKYRDFGSLVSLGDNKGVGSLMGNLSGPSFFVQGMMAKWMYIALHLLHHKAILGVSKTAVLVLARLLQKRVSGRLKLH